MAGPSAPCEWDFGPMLHALEGAGDEDAVEAEVIRTFQKEEQDKRARTAMAEAEAGAGAGAGRVAAAVEEVTKEDEATSSKRPARKLTDSAASIENEYTASLAAAAATAAAVAVANDAADVTVDLELPEGSSVLGPTGPTSEKLGVKAPPMPTVGTKEIMLTTSSISFGNCHVVMWRAYI